MQGVYSGGQELEGGMKVYSGGQEEESDEGRCTVEDKRRRKG
jgi:hypothetical protein